MDCPDQVLAGRKVDGSLASDAAVDHGKQGGRDLDIGDTPHPGGSSKTGHVADHSTAQRNHSSRAVDAGAGHELVEDVQRLQRLRGLPRGKLETMRPPATRLQGVLDRHRVAGADHTVGDHRHRSLDGGSGEHTWQKMAETGPDNDLVRKAVDVDCDPLHTVVRQCIGNGGCHRRRGAAVGGNDQVGLAITADSSRQQ